MSQPPSASALENELARRADQRLGPPPPSADEIRRMLSPYVTEWGNDPVWQSPASKPTPTVADFPLHTGYASGLTLAELPGTCRVVVAAHDVFWSPERKLWYCDIEIDAGDAYFPFVRLALARYQPHSVDGAHLSRVVMTDFIQLAPDRTAELTVSGSVAGITVSGLSGRNELANISRVPSLTPLADVVGGAVGGNVVGRAGAAARRSSGRSGGTSAEHHDARGATAAGGRRPGRSWLADGRRDHVVAKRE